jgi:hypothetical protein
MKSSAQPEYGPRFAASDQVWERDRFTTEKCFNTGSDVAIYPGWIVTGPVPEEKPEPKHICRKASRRKQDQRIQ